MNAANLKKDSLPSNSELCEACDLEKRLNALRTQNDLMESVLYRTKHPHVSMSDHIMVALQSKEIYHALNHLFETPLHYYRCLNNAMKFLPYDEMSWDNVTPLEDTMRAFAEIKDALLDAHLSTVNSIS